MKNYLLLLVCVFSANILFAQNNFLFHKVFPLDIDTTYYPGEFGYAIDFSPIVTDTIIGELVYAPEEASGNRTMCEESAEDYNDKFVLIHRGNCSFPQKVFNAQNRGAKAVIIVNFDDAFSDMTLGNFSEEITIPSIFISFSMGQDLRTKLLAEEQVIVAFTPDLTLSTNVFVNELELNIYPNPMITESVIELLGVAFSNGKIELFDALGRRVRTEEFFLNKFEIKRKDLKVGNYFYRILLDDKLSASGIFQVND